MDQDLEIMDQAFVEDMADAVDIKEDMEEDAVEEVVVECAAVDVCSAIKSVRPN